MISFKYLVTSALPYVNSRPHLGHLIGSILPPDVFTRYLRMKGEQAIYICGTDEHGTATELSAEKAGVPPEKWCEKYHKLHKEDYEWFGVDFTNFGRTSSKSNHELTQYIFTKNRDAGYVFEDTIQQLYCPKCERFLADRYVKAICPKCGAETNADQCDACGSLQDPADLKSPKCAICGADAELRETKHLFLDLPKFAPWLKQWLATKSFWRTNVINWARSLTNDLKPRCITRDLKWGVRVPLAGYEDKVFYVWFDAPIGYIAITKDADPQRLEGMDWHAWWTDGDTRLVHFLGKDNIPFHTIIFPSMLHGTSEFIVPHEVVGAEYLNYEGRKFSKSKGVGVTLEDARSLPFPPDYWRWALIQMAPETHDSDFSWQDFQKHANELADVFGNFVHRTFVLAHKYYGSVPKAGAFSEADKDMLKKIEAWPALVGEKLEKHQQRDAAKKALELVRDANAFLNAQEPWKREDTRANTLYLCLNVCRSASILLEPFIPSSCRRVRELLRVGDASWDSAADLVLEAGAPLGESEPLFKKVESVSEYEKRFSGKQEVSYVKYEDFSKLDLRVATVKKAEPVAGADKLLKLTLDVGELGERVVCAGVKQWYSPDDLAGKKVVYLANLEPRKMRGIESQGMVLAAELGNAVELLSAGSIGNGAKVL
ncbi:MAG: methionine--tRNA ligase [Candidatus Diapherotrites archaeon]|nr:methionine--tRNA ligase [Candidatus Diapherotrites archaeon]